MKLKNSKAALALTLGASVFAASSAFASSHREAPGIAGMPRVDATDFYMFRSYEPGRSGFVTLIANYIPVQAPYGGPNYFTLDNNAIYEIHIDNNGDAVEDITFQFDFDTALLNGTGIELDIGPAGQTIKRSIPLRNAGPITQRGAGTISETETYTLTMITGDRRTGTRTTLPGPVNGAFVKPIDNIGTKSLPNYQAYANEHIFPVNFGTCGSGKVFVGQRAEGFAVNLGRIFDLVNLVPIQGAAAPNNLWTQYNTTPFAGGIVQDRANDDLIGKANVTSLALEVPVTCLTGQGNGVIGGWTTASLPQVNLRDPLPAYNGTSVNGGAFVQVSRLSNPLVNEVVIGLKDKDLFNAAEPTQDGALAAYVTNPTLPALLDILFNSPNASGARPFGVANIAPSNFPRNDLVTAFLTGIPGFNQLARVTPSEMLRLNTAIPATPAAQQNTFGVVAEDLAGFPNGRRPGDDTVDIALRVVMGALCHPLPLGAELSGNQALQGTAGDNVNLGVCQPAQAPAGTVAFTDGAPLNASDFDNAFPYLKAPLPGARSPS